MRYRDTTNNEIAKAVEAANRADVVIAVVGGSSARDFKTTYKETGAAIADKSQISDMECGEGFDRATLSLLGKQLELLESLKSTRKPLIVVYIEGRPLNKNWAAEHADALLTAYYPGQEGGMPLLMFYLVIIIRQVACLFLFPGQRDKFPYIIIRKPLNVTIM